MPGPRIAAAFRVTPEQVDSLTRDLRMIEQGAVVLACFDPYEIINYCFPVTPGVQYVDATIDEIADDQAALEFGLFSEDFLPVLIDEYAAELRRYLSHLTFEANRAYDKAALVRELEMTAGVAEGDPEKARQFVELEEVKADFNVSLAVTLGKISIGVQRLREVVQRCNRRTDYDARIREALAGYKPGPVSQTIYDALGAEIQRQEPDPTSRRRKLRNALVDATAIERILHANRALAADSTSPRLILLYVSSAGRNWTIFSIPDVEAAQPIIDGKPYPIWRTREQLFVALLHKGTENEPVSHWIGRLSSWKDQYSRIRYLHGKIGQQPGEECIPSDCLQVGGTPADSCKWLELCRALDSDVQIKAKRAEIKNLGLIAAIATYTRVLKSLQQLQQDPAARVKAVVAALVSAPMRDLAMEKMFVENSMLLLQDDLRLAVADRKLETGGESEGAASDGVTNVVQSLPRRPRLITPEYRDLADRLIQYYDQPRVAMMDAARFVESVNPEFALLASRVPEGNGELELLRCLLHLAYPLRSGDARVVNSTDENCRKYPDQQAEFLYVGCWAARRMKRYAESILFADRGVALNRQDPRFYHGRALSIYCWIASGTAGCSKVMQDAIDDTVRAIELFELDPEAGRDREMLSACYNNAAYFSLVPDLSAPDGPSKASEFFDKLLQVLPRSQWTPKYPEYYHTESLLLYSRYLVQKQGGAKEGTARPHLVRAMGQLRTAVQLDPCQEYKELYDTMQRALGAPAKARSTP